MAPGSNAYPSVSALSAAPVSPAAGHQRRDGSRPSGNSSSTAVISGMKPHTQIEFASHSSASGTGRDPGSA